VGVASIAHVTRVEAYGLSSPGGGPRKEVLGGTLAGGATGAGVGAAVCVPSAIVPALYPICVATLGVTGLLVGTVAGEAVANTRDAKDLQQVLPAGREMQEALHRRVIDLATAQAKHPIVDLGALEPITTEPPAQTDAPFARRGRASYPAEYRKFAAQGIDHMLETSVLSVAIHGAGPGKYRLLMECQSRLINIAKDDILITTHRYRGPVFSLAEDAADDRAFKHQIIEAGIESIAREIVSNYFPGPSA
jgi:hypothetical protein